MNFGTIAFGQRFEVTPIQMIGMIGTIANKGTYVKPRVVKQIIDSKTGEKTDIEVETKGNAISKETAENVLSMMETVVAEGTREKCTGTRISHRRKNRNFRRWC